MRGGGTPALSGATSGAAAATAALDSAVALGAASLGGRFGRRIFDRLGAGFGLGSLRRSFGRSSLGRGSLGGLRGSFDGGRFLGGRRGLRLGCARLGGAAFAVPTLAGAALLAPLWPARPWRFRCGLRRGAFLAGALWPTWPWRVWARVSWSFAAQLLSRMLRLGARFWFRRGLLCLLLARRHRRRPSLRGELHVVRRGGSVEACAANETDFAPRDWSSSASSSEATARRRLVGFEELGRLVLERGIFVTPRRR